MALAQARHRMTPSIGYDKSYVYIRTCWNAVPVTRHVVLSEYTTIVKMSRMLTDMSVAPANISDLSRNTSRHFSTALCTRYSSDGHVVVSLLWWLCLSSFVHINIWRIIHSYESGS